jgi:fermentation-respiration switch protein FrsA (DUF1100 family)
VLPLRWTALLVVLAALVLVAASGGVSWVFSNKLLVPPDKPLGPVDLTDAGLPQPKQVAIPGDGVTLSGWLFANPHNGHCAVVMLHGFAGDKTEVVAPAPIFWRRGCDLLLYDSRGHGDSSKALLTFGFHERQDLLDAIDWLVGRTKLPRSRIGLIGWSYGAAVAIQAASEPRGDVAFVIADSSFSSLGAIARHQAQDQFGSWAKLFVPGALLVSSLRAGFDARDSAPDKAIRSVRSPVFLIHSRQDEFTPVVQSERIYAHSNKARTQLLIPGWSAPHALSYTRNPTAYAAAVDRFLRKFAPRFGLPQTG